jgi:hypothetical protein
LKITMPSPWTSSESKCQVQIQNWLVPGVGLEEFWTPEILTVNYEPMMVLEKKKFKWPHHIFAFLQLSPLWKWPGPLYVQTWILFMQVWFASSLIEIGLLKFSLVILRFDLKLIATEIIFVRFVVEYASNDHIKNRQKSIQGKVSFLRIKVCTFS